MSTSDNKKSESPEKPEIEYPCRWQYKVIGEDQDKLIKAIEDTAAPVPVTITYSHSSSGGKYHSYNAELEVQDEEARLSVYKALHDHPDIKMVL